MRGWWRCAVVPGMLAVGSTALGAQAAPENDICLLVTEVEFQEAQGIHPTLGIIPTDPPVLTEMVWGPHCDYSPGSIDMFTKKSPKAELERVLEISKGGKQRAAVQGLGRPAFFTTVYPDDKYRRRGFLVVTLDKSLLAISMDPTGDDPPESTRPKLEGLAKLALSRLQ